MRINVYFPIIMKAEINSWIEFDANASLNEVKRRIFDAFSRVWPGIALAWRDRIVRLYVRDQMGQPSFEITAIQRLHAQIASSFIVEFEERNYELPGN